MDATFTLFEQHERGIHALCSWAADVDGHRLCVVRLGDDWYVIGDECSHADFSLAEGDVWEDECEIECPKHGSTFSLTSGEPQ